MSGPMNELNMYTPWFQIQVYTGLKVLQEVVRLGWARDQPQPILSSNIEVLVLRLIMNSVGCSFAKARKSHNGTPC